MPITTAPELVLIHPNGGEAYEAALRSAFNFMRAHDDGRYSSTTKMKVLNAAEHSENARVRGITTPLPTLALISVPFGFDEDTEVKSGGLLAVAVRFPTDAKLLVATHREHRRNGHGRRLIEALRQRVNPNLLAWVNRSNVGGQHFLLTLGFTPSGFNASGGVSWVYGEEGTDGVEDHQDPLDVLRRNLQQPRYDSLWREGPEDRYDEDEPDDGYCDNPECSCNN